jgi:hypothetical protein
VSVGKVGAIWNLAKQFGFAMLATLENSHSSQQVFVDWRELEELGSKTVPIFAEASLCRPKQPVAETFRMPRAHRCVLITESVLRIITLC